MCVTGFFDADFADDADEVGDADEVDDKDFGRCFPTLLNRD